MTDQQKLQCLLSKIRKTASREHCLDKWGDDYCPADNGNYDDAFSDGTNYGEIAFARELLQCIADEPEAQYSPPLITSMTEQNYPINPPPELVQQRSGGTSQ